MDFVQRMYEVCVSFYSESGIRKMMEFFASGMGNVSLAEEGKKLLLWAVVFLCIGFLVDQVLYWTRPDHRAMMVRPWHLVARWIREIGERTSKHDIGDADEQN